MRRSKGKNKDCYSRRIMAHPAFKVAVLAGVGAAGFFVGKKVSEGISLPWQQQKKNVPEEATAKEPTPPVKAEEEQRQEDNKPGEEEEKKMDVVVVTEEKKE